MMSSRLRTGGALLSVVAALCAGGSHWLVLQSIAWGQMLVSYSQSGSLRDAAVKTFDGRHPCSLCLKVQRGQQEEREQSKRRLLERQPDLWWGPERVRVPAPPSRQIVAVAFGDRMRDDFCPEPPSPPPKRA